MVISMLAICSFIYYHINVWFFWGFLVFTFLDFPFAVKEKKNIFFVSLNFQAVIFFFFFEGLKASACIFKGGVRGGIENIVIGTDGKK